jgi:hypothetical protein
VKSFQLITLFIFWSFSNLMAQCGFDNFYFTDLTPACPGTFSSACVFGGEYVSVSVIQNNIYTFSTCGFIAFDTQITVYDEFATTVLAYNDDFCGVGSEVTWVASYTGVVYVLVDEYFCFDNAICAELSVTCNGEQGGGSGCNTDVILCQNTGGPFFFGPPGNPVSSCLDYLNISQFAYIMVNITTTGFLNLLIEGNATTGFLDVAVFNIPNGVDACVAIQDLNNEIGCNYAIAFSGCNQFGTTYPCPSSVPSPFVTAGQTIMIVVEDWQDGASTQFNLQLGPPPNAQSGPANASITPMGPFCITSPPIQLIAQDLGGEWTGSGTSASGIFDPTAAGLGTHPINYSIGQPPCQALGNTTVTVVNAPVASAAAVDVSICQGENGAVIFNGTPSSIVNYNINGGAMQSILLNASGTATLNTAALTAGFTVNLISVTIPGPPPCTSPIVQPPVFIDVNPAPVISPVYHD